MTDMPIKLPASYFVDLYNMVLKFIQKGKRLRTVNMILKNRVRVLILPDFKTYSKAIVIKIEQTSNPWKRKESLEKDPSIVN